MLKSVAKENKISVDSLTQELNSIKLHKERKTEEVSDLDRQLKQFRDESLTHSIMLDSANMSIARLEDDKRRLYDQTGMDSNEQ